MNRVATPVPVPPCERMAPQGTGIYIAEALPLASVRQSFAYRNRMRITALCLTLGLIRIALDRPAELTPLSNLEWELLGWPLFCAGAALRIWSSSYICARKSVAVVCAGPYSLCRNPLYWGTFLMVAAFPLFLKSPALALAMLPPVMLYLFAVVPVEESVMASRHGEEYAAYCQSVPRWWPRFRGYAKGAPLDSQSIGFRRECYRMFWWLALAIALPLLMSVR